MEAIAIRLDAIAIRNAIATFGWRPSLLDVFLKETRTPEEKKDTKETEVKEAQEAG